MTELSKKSKNDQWRCEICEFDNVEGLTFCQMCESPKKKEPKIIDHPHKEGEMIMKELKEPGIICPSKTCNHYNSLHAQICSKCKTSLFEQYFQSKPDKHSAKANMKYCYMCAFENHPSNKTCVGCDINLLEKAIWSISMGHKGGKGMKKKNINEYYCEDCGGKVELVDPKKQAMGLRIQYSDFICRKCSKLNIAEGKLCVFCDQNLSKEEMEFHDDVCQPRIAFFKREGNPTFDRCSKLQVDTVHYMHKKCQEFHQASKYMLIYRIKKLGYSEKDLGNLHHYIMHYAPIIIHMRAANFQHFTKDTHYRNCFEVAKINVPSRVQWEDRMFDQKHHRASFFERVKYGTMNFTNDPKGVNACLGYGHSYFLLKSHVRDRCTITDMDSAAPSATIGTFRFVFHVLTKLSDAELKAAFEGSKGKEMLSNVIAAYKEIQIHGPVEFSKDIERVYLCRQQFAGDHGNIQKLAKEFCEKNKLEYEFFDRKVDRAMVFGGVHTMKVEVAPERILGDSKLKQEKKEKPKERDHLKYPGYFHDPYDYQQGYEEIYDEDYDDEYLYQ